MVSTIGNIYNILLALILIGIGIYILYQRNKGKTWKKIIGVLLIALGILFIEPSPDPISLGVYSILHGLDFSAITAENVASILWNFEVWTIMIGLILLVIGGIIMGWDFKKLWRKINLERYWIAFFLAILIVVLIAWIDVQGMVYWGSFSTTDAYVTGQQGTAFWSFFKSIVFVIFAILPFAYYFLYRRDKSEAISLFVGEWILWMFGFADLMFFVLSQQLIPSSLVWLNTHPIIGTISNVLGYENVTSVSLLFSVFVGFILAYLTGKILKDKF
jgi:hypothetical protein